MLHVNTSMLHVDIKNSHVDIGILDVDMIYMLHVEGRSMPP